MIDSPIPELTPASKKPGCMRAVVITLLIMTVLLVLLVLWGFKLLMKNPAVNKRYTDMQATLQCKANLEEIGGALERYSRRNGQYPATLDQLYPNFMEKQTTLHCPADPRPGEVSYDYYPPAMNAPANTLVVECRRHVAFEDQAPWKLQLRKNGEIISEDLVPRPNASTDLGED